MPAKYALTAIALLLFGSATNACADDLVLRPHGSHALSTASDTASPAACPRGELTAAAEAREASDKSKTESLGVAAKPQTRPHPLAADGGHEDAAVSTASLAGDAPPMLGEGASGKTGGARKAGGALRWQSLLPGVMK